MQTQLHPATVTDIVATGVGHPGDSRAWQVQVWIAMAISVALSGIGLAYLPGTDVEQAFLVLGYLFCVSSAFVVAKMVRDGQQSAEHAGDASSDTPLFKYLVWGSFFAAIALTGWGLLRMQISGTYKAFLGVSWLYLISSALTLAKMLRDRHEAELRQRL